MMGPNQRQTTIADNPKIYRIDQATPGASELNALLGLRTDCALNMSDFSHRRIKAGQFLVRAGQEFETLYVVNGGFFKTLVTDDCGNEQIISFPMKGDLIGADGIGDQTHVNDVIALSDADVVIIPFTKIGVLNPIYPALEASLFRSISRQLVEEQYALVAIGALCVESRLARFLIKCGQRMAERGYCAHQFNLQMSRQDIGNYLSMKIETVSRSLTALTAKGLIQVKQREVTIIDPEQLANLARASSIAKGEQINRSTRTSGASRSQRSTPVKAATPWSMIIDAPEAARALT